MKKLLVLMVGLLLVSSAQPAQSTPRKEDLPKLVKDLRSGASTKVRVAAAEDIGKLGQIRAADAKDAIPLLIEVVKKDKEPSVRAAAALALGQIDPDPKEAVPVLVDALKNDKEPRAVRIAVANGLGGLGSGAKDAVKEMRAVAKKEQAKPEQQRDKQLVRAVQQSIKLIMAK